MYSVEKKCIWNDFGPYYRNGDYVFQFDGAEEGNFWISKLINGGKDMKFVSNIPLDLIADFNKFVTFVKKQIRKNNEQIT